VTVSLEWVSQFHDSAIHSIMSGGTGLWQALFSSLGILQCVFKREFVEPGPWKAAHSLQTRSVILY
jgi:hypothetical protein